MIRGGAGKDGDNVGIRPHPCEVAAPQRVSRSARDGFQGQETPTGKERTKRVEGPDQVTLETPQGGTNMLPWALFGGHHNGWCPSQGRGPRWSRTVGVRDRRDIC